MEKYQRVIWRTSIWLCLVCLPISAFGADKVTLQLIWKNQFQFAGYYIAKELGFYDAAELENALEQALKAVRTLGIPLEENLAERSAIGRTDIPLDLDRDVVDYF